VPKSKKKLSSGPKIGQSANVGEFHLRGQSPKILNYALGSIIFIHTLCGTFVLKQLV
jgi:hypothetical protein